MRSQAQLRNDINKKPGIRQIFARARGLPPVAVNLPTDTLTLLSAFEAGLGKITGQFHRIVAVKAGQAEALRVHLSGGNHALQAQIT